MMPFPASDEFIVWAQSLSGMLTKIRTEFGSMPEMVESTEWDEGRTQYALALLKSLNKHLSETTEELAIHVAEKFGQNDG